MNKRNQARSSAARRIPIKDSWSFFAVSGTLPSEFRWQWQKQGAAPAVTSPLFDFYFDCISDARANGYAGPLPPGPRAARAQLPFAPAQAGRAPAPQSAKSNNVMMTVSAMPAVDVKARRTHSRYRVTAKAG